MAAGPVVSVSCSRVLEQPPGHPSDGFEQALAPAALRPFCGMDFLGTLQVLEEMIAQFVAKSSIMRNQHEFAIGDEAKMIQVG